MALAKRIIPCLDVTGGRVVKGVNFVALRDAGDPVEIARRYDDQGADELCFLDITASSDERDTIVQVIEAVAEQVFIPLTVGGGVRTVADVRKLLNAGADKVSINTAAVQDPALVEKAAGRFGSQCIVVAVDAKQVANGGARGGRSSRTAGGARRASTRWLGEKRMQAAGAGEILLTSMDRDGTKAGFDLALTRAFSDALEIPIIASGGAGNLDHLVDAIEARPRRCGPCREHLPLRRVHDRRGQAPARGARHRGEVSDRFLARRGELERRRAGAGRDPGCDAAAGCSCTPG